MIRSRLKSIALIFFGALLGVVLTVASGVWLSAGDGQDHVPPRVRVEEGPLRAALASANSTARSTATMAGRGGNFLSAAALAQAIRFSRGQARTEATWPVPDSVRARLAPYFPERTLAKARWTIAGRRISLGTVLAGWYYREGAVTLDDTIVFSTAGVARDVGLWAHELTHVRQYEELGVDDFARLYVAHWATLENQAWDNSRLIVADLAQRGKGNSALPPLAAAATGPASAAGPVGGIRQATSSSAQ